MKLFYNGLMFSHVRVNSLGRQPVYSEGNDYLYTHNTLDISGVINPQAGAYGLDEDGKVVPIPGSSATMTDTTIRHYLLQPRRQLVLMTVNGEILLLAPQRRPGEGNTGYYPVDANGGPAPRVHNITRIDGDKTFHINWSCDVWINECPTGNNSTIRALLSNRFSQQHTIDDNFMTQIVTTGQAFFRLDVLENANEVADTYRRLCLPPVPLGFKRTSVNVAVTAARNVLTYTCVDQETFFDIGDTNPLLGGSGVTRIEAQYQTGTVSNEGGVAGGRSFASMNVRIWGCKESSLWHLTQKAFLVAGAKLPLDKMPNGGILSSINLMQNMTGRDVSLQVQVMLPPPNVGKLGVLETDILRKDDLFEDHFGKNPAPYNDGGSRGSYNRQILTSKLKDACTSVGKSYESKPGTSGASTDYGDYVPVDANIVYTDIVPPFQPKISYNEKKSFHTDYRLDYKYKRKHHKIQAPIAKNPFGDQSQSSPFPPQNPTSQNPSTDPSNQPALIPDCEVMALAYPTSQVEVTWTAERVGEPPRYPNPANVEQNFVLMDDKLQPASKELMPDGQNFVYRVSGHYTYALLSARGAGDNLPTGCLPLWDDIYENSYLESKYAVPGIIGPNPSQQG